MTDLELQLWLAARLPERIVYDAAFNRFHWLEEADRTSSAKKVVWPGIKYTEWDYIVRCVEQQQIENEDTGYAYDMALQKQVGVWESLDGRSGLKMPNIMKAWNASWQQRTRALIATLGETKGEK